MAKNPKLAVIILLSILLLVGLSTIVVLSVMSTPDEDPVKATDRYFQETNRSIATTSQTSTQTESLPNEITDHPNVTATPSSDIELVPIPSPHLTTPPN